MKYSAALRRLSDGETSMNDFDNEILPTDPDEGEEITERVAGRETYEWVRSLVGAVLVITLLFTFVVRLMGVDGHSMVPTLQDGDYVALLSNLFMGDLEQGDVIVARKESFENGEPIVKRVIATEGQTVDILYDGNGYGTVYVDGEPLDEPYILEPMVQPYYDRTSFPVTVDEGCLVVMGDNRNRSADSRYASIGQIEESQVIGKVLCILFPGCGESSSRDFGRIGALDNG